MTSEQNRRSHILSMLHPLLAELSGFDPDDLDPSVTFLEMGFESLILIQLSQSIQRTFDIKVSFRQLIEQIETLDGLVAFLDAQLPPDAFLDVATQSEAPAPAVPIAAPVVTAPTPSVDPPVMGLPAPSAIDVTRHPGALGTPQVSSGMEAIMRQQLQIMSLQLEALRGAAAPVHTSPVIESTAPPVATPPPGIKRPDIETLDIDVKALQRQRFGPYKPIKRGVGGRLPTNSSDIWMP
ncbi:hypothetical protein C2W62_18365 [Candidatus Entotheonella serta]|nr:hypothetical protein C2W62_18365 [Candidatus Entotheonella serta]